MRFGEALELELGCSKPDIGERNVELDDFGPGDVTFVLNSDAHIQSERIGVSIRGERVDHKI